MKAIILAAGRGTRMGAVTRDQPKCLTEIGGRRLLAWQIAALREAAVDNITIIGGYRKELLEPYADRILENTRWAETNMVATLALASEILRHHDCIISYSDILYHPEIIRVLSVSKADIAITYDLEWKSLWSDRFDDPGDDAEGFEEKNGVLISIGAKPKSINEVEGQYMGLLKISPPGWLEIENYLSGIGQGRTDRLDMTGLLAGLLNNNRPIETIAIAGKWCEIDNQTDLELYRCKIAEGENWTHDWRWETA